MEFIVGDSIRHPGGAEGALAHAAPISTERNTVDIDAGPALNNLIGVLDGVVAGRALTDDARLNS